MSAIIQDLRAVFAKHIDTLGPSQLAMMIHALLGHQGAPASPDAVVVDTSYTKLDQNDQPLPADAPDSQVYGIHDHAQQLIWAGPALFIDKTFKHKDALKHAQALGKGFDLGTRKQVLNLVDDTRCKPAAHPAFAFLKDKWVWTSTLSADDEAVAWCVYFGYGGSGLSLRYNDGYVFACRPASQ